MYQSSLTARARAHKRHWPISMRTVQAKEPQRGPPAIRGRLAGYFDAGGPVAARSPPSRPPASVFEQKTEESDRRDPAADQRHLLQRMFWRHVLV